MMINIKILDILDKKDRNLNWLANSAGITYSTLYNFAHQNTSSVTYDVLEKLCNTLECDVCDIINYVPTRADIIPESELQMLENTTSVIAQKTDNKEFIEIYETMFLYDLLIKVMNSRSKFNEYEYDRFYQAYTTCLRLLPYELSSQALKTFISNINTDSSK